MAIKINGKDLSKRIINGHEVEKVIRNGVQIRPESTPPVPSTPLCFSGIYGGVYSIGVRLILHDGSDDRNLQFEISNNLVDWRDYTLGTYFSVTYGGTTYIRSKSSSVVSLGTIDCNYRFQMETVSGIHNIVNVSGDPGYLLCKTSTDTIPLNGFATLFSDFKKAEFNGLVLPATTVGEAGYAAMFAGTDITTAPQLPATTLGPWCYYNMFYGCYSLTTPPQLSATTLNTCCYNGMFSFCSSLNKIPQLPATTLRERCYTYMFFETGITLSDTQTGVYQNPYRIPSSGTGTITGRDALKDMFGYYNTPNINQTYYTDAQVI